MARISYKQARDDHDYLWSLGPANDMTGGYVDQEDLARLLREPTKAMARRCYLDQIEYWFSVGPQGDASADPVPWRDPKVWEIAERHGIETPET